METERNDECYRASGKAAWLRLILLGPFLLVASIVVGWGLSTAFVHGWYYRIVTPAFAGIVVGVTTRWVVGLSHCRNKGVAAVLGGMAGLLAFVSYYHMHMIAGITGCGIGSACRRLAGASRT